MFYRTRTFRLIGLLLAFTLIIEGFFPVVVYALTSGPTQPEFSTFTPVGADDLVSTFTGDFSYNIPVISIPGPNGMGYALGLSYNSGASVEEEASWVGFGWNLNAGAINRAKRGFPDDVKEGTMTYWNNVRPNWTATSTKRLGLEFFSKEKGSTPADPSTPRQNWATLNGQVTQRYNNYKGYGYSYGLTAGVMGVGNLGWTETDGLSNFSYSVNPLALLEKLKFINLSSIRPTVMDRWLKYGMKNALNQFVNNAVTQSSSSSGLFGMFNFNDWSMPYNSPEYTGFAIDLAGAVEGDPFGLPMGVEGGFKGTFASQWSPNKTNKSVYGYLYSGDVADDKSLMDYYVEKEGMYQKRDQYLPIPFSNADHYMVSGQSLSGSFRAYQSEPGTFRPNAVSSNTYMGHGNVDVHLGATGGIGLAGGFGVQNFSVNPWANDDYAFPKVGETDEPFFFRFTGDLGGSIEFAENDDPSSAKFQMSTPVTVSGVNVQNIQKRLNTSGTSTIINPAYRSGRSTYIGYNTNSEMLNRPPMSCFNEGGTVKYRRYSKRSVEDEQVGPLTSEKALDRNESVVKDGVGEFSITKGNGTKYIYGLPVYSRKEANLQVGVQGIRASDIDNNYIAYRYVPAVENDQYSIVGDECDIPYATSHLLTEIRSPDYVDRSNNGPSLDDLGGYVSFKYKRTAGSTSKTSSTNNWYRWRAPYRGLFYQRNSLSDPLDDAGTVSSGYKELYYLSTIETKTHIAVFHTEPRKDGYEAVQNERVAASSSTATTADGNNEKMQCLKKIELYAKDKNGDQGKLLVTVNFEYDYSLCQGVYNADPENGKLTLKRLWFEYEGVKDARISPYEFGYNYKGSDFYRTDVQAPLTQTGEEYANIVEFADDLIAYGVANSTNPQNPDYSPFDIDAWGNYQKDGKDRYDKFNPWVNQQAQEGFDPAAWQLKQIKLPSGGEIHVQYEQDEYRYVQHRPAMIMVPLLNGDKPLSKFCLDLDNALTMPTDANEYEALVDKVADQMKVYFQEGVYGEDPEHAFFRFVYALEGNNAALNQCSSEFISGYAKVKSNSIITQGTGLNKKIWLTLGDPAKDYTIPDKVCENYVRTNRAGVIKFGDCSASSTGVKWEYSDGDFLDITAVILKLLFLVGDYYDSDENCKTINYLDSYIRIPLPDVLPKKGGGLRVKRLLMVDRGIEGTEDAALYGTEYIYETEDGLCSGVATNEPTAGREENSLMTLINKREAQNGYEKLFAGEDRDQFEGPIGQSIMPGASVGYSRVVTRNIYPGKSTTGYAVNQFYTANDYPFDLKYAKAGEQVTKLGTARTSMNKPYDLRLNIFSGVVNHSRNEISRSQGFRFIINEMHGKPKIMSTHSGNYLTNEERQAQSLPDWKPSSAIQKTVYDYFQPGEPIPVMKGSSMSDIQMANLGKEMEVVLESRQVEDITNDGSLELDLGVGVIGLFPLPFFSGALGVGFSNTTNLMRSHVTTKVIKYPVIQKKVTVFKDGATDVTEYLAFNPESGSPILVRTSDGYDNLTLSPSTTHDGSYYSHSIPATWEYPTLKQKAIAERAMLRSNTSQEESGYIIEKRYLNDNVNGERHYLTIRFTKPGVDTEFFDLVSSGDLVRLTSGEGSSPVEIGVYHVGTIAGTRIELLPTSISLRDTQVEVPDVNIEIVHSGRLNYLNDQSGQFTTYGMEPIVVEHPLQ